MATHVIHWLPRTPQRAFGSDHDRRTHLLAPGDCAPATTADAVAAHQQRNERGGGRARAGHHPRERVLPPAPAARRRPGRGRGRGTDPRRDGQALPTSLRPARVEVDRRGHGGARGGGLLRRFPHRQRGKGTFTDAELWVAPETWEQAVEMLVEASMLVHREARPPHAAGAVPETHPIAVFRRGGHQRGACLSRRWATAGSGGTSPRAPSTCSATSWAASHWSSPCSRSATPPAPWASCWQPTASRWSRSCSSAACSPTGSGGPWSSRSATSPPASPHWR